MAVRAVWAVPGDRCRVTAAMAARVVPRVMVVRVAVERGEPPEIAAALVATAVRVELVAPEATPVYPRALAPPARMATVVLPATVAPVERVVLPGRTSVVTASPAVPAETVARQVLRDQPAPVAAVGSAAVPVPRATVGRVETAPAELRLGRPPPDIRAVRDMPVAGAATAAPVVRPQQAASGVMVVRAGWAAPVVPVVSGART
ncbi:MAG: hypothetical protein U0Q47_13110 [Mycobacterium sp.]